MAETAGKHLTNRSASAILVTMNKLLDQLTDYRWRALDYLDAITRSIETVRREHRGI